MARMKHVGFRLPSALVDELRKEGADIGYGMSWVVRRRLEASRETSLPQSRRSEGIVLHGGGGKLQTQTRAEV